MSRRNQTRDVLPAVLEAAGPQGMRTRDLVQSLIDRGVQMKTKSFEVMLLRYKSDGLIFGKGAYMPNTKGLVFRYFGRPDWCEAYVFEGALDPALREQRDKELAQERWRKYREEHRPAAREREVMSHEERLARDRERRKGYRAKKREARIAAGEKVRALSGNSERTIRRRERAAGLPAKVPRKGAGMAGVHLVVRDDRVAAPVSVARKPVLVGEPVFTSQTRVTIAPAGIDYRYHVDPATVERVFSGRRIGVYLSEAEVV